MDLADADGDRPQASRWIEARTGRSIRKFLRAARRYRTIEIQAGGHTITPPTRHPTTSATPRTPSLGLRTNLTQSEQPASCGFRWLF
jgi:hypothetical protein